MDGEPVKSCTVLAATAERYEITTVEGLERDGVLDPVQQGFHEEHGLQCGFCTPGMLLTARALLDRNPYPTRRGDPHRHLRADLPLHGLRDDRALSIRWAGESAQAGDSPDDVRRCTLARARDASRTPLRRYRLTDYPER